MSSKRRYAGVRLFLMAVLALFFCGALPSTADDPTLEEQIEAWRQSLRAAQAELSSDFENREPADVMADLREIQNHAGAVRRSAEGELSHIRQMLEPLQPEPGEEGATEADAILELRRELEESAAQYSAWMRIAGATENVASELAGEIAGWQQQHFRRELARQMPWPITWEVWEKAGHDARAFTREVADAPLIWWRERQAEGESRLTVILFVLLPLLGLLLGWPMRKIVLQHFGRNPSETTPTYARRIAGAVADGTANALVPAAMMGLVILILYLQGLLTGVFAVLVYEVFIALAGYLMLFGLSRAVLSPYLVAWRILPVAPARVTVLLWGIRVTALVMMTAGAILSLLLFTGLNTEELEAVVLFVSTVLVAVTAGWVLSPGFWMQSVEGSQEAVPADSLSEKEDTSPDGESEDDSRHILNRLRGVLRLVILAAPLTAVIGYSRLAYFAQSRVISTALLIGFGLLLRIAVRELVQRFFLSPPVRINRASPVRRLWRSEGGLKVMTFWVGVVADVLIAVLLIYGLLLLYGVPPEILALWTQNVLSGIEIGGFRLAPGKLLIAVLVLSGGLVLTNLFRRWLTTSVLPNTRLEYGVRDSIASGSSYVGVGIALVLAIGALGLDFTNLALVVGALSLGIGFGLRNVVENFVAGVLLLIERPVKAGDWVIVGEHEGTVRNISVRSTEIETFDRASVIVPNAALISSSVVNWTHKNRLARERISVGVAYGSDTEQVARILLRCADEHAKVLRIPPPITLFVGFGDSSLDFELRCFIGDTDDFMTVRSELHFSIERALHDAGIVIPFPQRDLHIHRKAPQEESAAKGEADEGSG